MESSLWSRLAARLRAALPPWPLALAAAVVAGAVPLAFGLEATAALRYERAALAAGEGWRLLTAHVVHFDLRHYAMNAAGLGVLWWLFARDARPRQWLAVAVASILTIDAGLWFLRPDLGWYVGASGVLHGFWAAAGVAALTRWRLEGAVTLVLLAAKLAFERATGPLGAALDGALPVIVDAHLYGAVGGLSAALAMRLWRQSL
jgi:rhomboid family GlyGly-CTERM serine protease